ncbi:hypothetical protein FTHG_01093 [Francisella tularensis subsp. holarctica 257]|nr:hypothetical protein FTHG_01093 [Francisella tularensis subsp. holarctica 257]OLY97934.1 hypothetical protein BPP09_04920 [Francisella tularensis subsp. holarctica]
MPTSAFFTLVNENKNLLKDICYTVEKSGVTGIVVESTFSYSPELFKENQQDIKLNIKNMSVRVRDGKVKRVTSIDRNANTEAILQSIYDNIIAFDEQDLERLFTGFRILKQENSTNTNKAVFNIGLTYHPITNNAFVEFNKD